MLSSTLPDNTEDAELAVTTNINRIKENTSSSLNLLSYSSSETEEQDEEESENQDQANNKTVLKKRMTLMHFLIAYNREILCFLTLFLTTYATLHNKYGARTPYYPINSRPIFDQNSVIEEFYKGQLTPLQTKVSVSGISAILFYAPWSANSLYVKQYFESLAKSFQNEIYFAAVNCWQPGGECRLQHSKVKSWPVLVVYYPKSLAVQYNGPWQLGPLYKFLRGILKPLKRIHSKEELIELNKRHSVLVVGYFKNVNKKYQNFYRTAAKWLEYDPLQDVKFCILSGVVFDDFQLKNESEIKIIFRGHTLNDQFNSWSMNNLISSIKKQTRKLAKNWNGFHRQDTESFQYNIKQNPTLLYFVKRDYVNENNTAEMILNEVIEKYENFIKIQKVDEKNSTQTSTEGNDESEYNLDAYGNSIITRKTESNQMLSFYLLDIFLYYKLAFQLGLSNSNFKLQQSTAVIIDNLKESVYVFPKTTSLTKESLTKFVNDFQSNNLKRNFRLSDTSKLIKNEKRSKDSTGSINERRIQIPEINGEKFHDLIIKNKKNKFTTIVLITSKSCSLCTTLKLNILSLTRIFQNLAIQFYIIDGNNNDLKWQFTMGQYPTLLIIPKFNNKKQDAVDDIRILPYDIEPNQKNIIGFIMANLEVSDRLLGFLEYCSNLKVSNGLQNCLKMTRQVIDSIINEQLNLWRNFRTRRKCLENKLIILRELYYKLLNSKNADDVKKAFPILNTVQPKLQNKHIDIRFSCDNEIKNKIILQS